MAGEGFSKGWISLYRKIQDSWLWQEKPFSKGQAWLDLLLLANHEDKKIALGNELILVKRGSFITSEIKLMQRWGWGKEKTRNFLKMLQEDGMITKISDHKKTTINIDNYSVYQPLASSSQTSNRPPADCEQTVSRPSADTNNNDNNINNYNNENKRESLTHSQALEICNYYGQLKPGEFINSQLPAIKIWIEDYGYDWTKDAVQLCASKKNKFIVPWINKVLQSWQTEGKEEHHGSDTGNNQPDKSKHKIKINTEIPDLSGIDTSEFGEL